MPIAYQYFREHMMELHPGWEYRFWMEKNRPKLRNEKLYQSLSRYMFKSDLLRYEILYQYGGVYVDTDILFYKNMEPLLVREYFITRDQWGIQNCIMGITPGHPLLEYLIMKIPENIPSFEKEKQKDYHGAGVNLIGPNMLGKCLYEFIEHPIVYHPKYFFPSDFYEIKENCEKEYPEAYGIHLYNSRHGNQYLNIHKTLPCYKRKFGLT